MLTGAYSPRRICEIAKDRWGLRTRKRKRIGGSPLTLSAIYCILTNPFYAGILLSEGRSFPGKHPPVVKIDEFERVQELLGRPGRPRPKKHQFAFTGMIRCGECGFSVTAEHQRNRHGSPYTYYHCTKRYKGKRCCQPYISLASLETQILAFLERITIPERFHEWLLARLESAVVEKIESKAAQCVSVEKAKASVARQLDNLTKLRLRDLLTDEEYVSQRQQLEQEQIRLSQTLEQMGKQNSRFEFLQEFISFGGRAISWFSRGNNQIKRQILETVGSNLTLKDKKLSIEVRKPFRLFSKSDELPEMWTFIEDVRTLFKESAPSLEKTMDGIRRLRKLLDSSELEKVA